MNKYYYVKTTDEFGSTVSVIEYKLVNEGNYSLTYLNGKCSDCGTHSHETGSGHCWGTQFENFEEVEKHFLNASYVTS